MTYQDQAINRLKELVKDYNFTNGRNHIIKFNPIEIWFVFGKNITAKFSYSMGAWYELESRTKESHRFYWKDQETTDWVKEEIRRATTCFCGATDFKYSDGYPYMVNCFNNKGDYKCKPIEINQFSNLVINYTR